MTPTPTQVREWIEDSVGFYDGVEEAMPDAFRGLLTVARAWLDLHTECEECDGSGASERLLYNQDGVPQFHADGTELYESCPACAGRGYTLNPGRVTEVVALIDAGTAFKNRESVVEAAILAYLGGPS